VIKNFKRGIKKRLLDSDWGTLLFYNIRTIREWLALAFIDDYNYIIKEYKKRYGKEINLKNPQTISEKLQWLKLFYRNENMPVCSDKCDIKLYLQKYSYEHLLNEVIVVLHSDEEIDCLDINSLPDKFVAKATHGSSWNLICANKNELNWNLWKKTFKKWLTLNLYVFGREWNYMDLKPKILIEEFIDYKPLIDYKFTCFNGEPKYIQVNSEKDDNRFVDFYDMDWNHLRISLKNYVPSEDKIIRPEQFDEMKTIAEKLSGQFPYVRVDFYNFNMKIILGELTFFPGGGLLKFYPDTEKYEILFGSYLKLPEPNYNLELHQKIQNS
jgi:hypothetical protein